MNKINRDPHIAQIITELTEPHATLQTIQPAISIYGSARTPRHHPDYLFTEKLAQALSNAGFAVLSGGGPGIMEAANKGAYSGCSPSIGLNIQLPHEQQANPYQDFSFTFQHFFSRKTMFIYHTTAFIVMPGGIGTLDELFESFTHIQTKKIPPYPIILVGSQFWHGLYDWMQEQLIHRQFIQAEDLKLLQIMDDETEIINAILTHHQSCLRACSNSSTAN